MRIWTRVNDDGTVTEIHEVVVYRCETAFGYGEIQVEPIVQQYWQSQAGTYILRNCIEQPRIQSFQDHQTYTRKFIISAKLTKEKLTEYYLRFDGNIGL